MARIRATVTSGRSKSAHVIRMHLHPVSSAIIDSRCFSRSTASTTVSSRRRCFTYFSRPSNSSHTPSDGQTGDQITRGITKLELRDGNRHPGSEQHEGGAHLAHRFVTRVSESEHQ